jgi:hypothetical protein
VLAALLCFSVDVSAEMDILQELEQVEVQTEAEFQVQQKQRHHRTIINLITINNVDKALSSHNGDMYDGQMAVLYRTLVSKS